MILFALKVLLVSICGAYLTVACCPLVDYSEQRNPFFYAKNADDFAMFTTIVIAEIVGISLFVILMTYGTPEDFLFDKNMALIYCIGANFVIPLLKLFFIILDQFVLVSQKILFKVFRNGLRNSDTGNSRSKTS